MPLAPVMIYGDDVTHVLTEEGIAYLYRAESLEERRAMVAAVAGITDIGLGVDARRVAELRHSGKVVYPEDIGIRRSDATRSLLAAGSVADRSNGPTVFTTHLPNSGAGNETPVTDSCRATDREAGDDRPRLPDRRSAIKPEAGSGGQPGKRRPSRPVVRSDGALGAQPDPDVSATGPAQLAAPDIALRETVGRLGREGERQMMAATDGVNTHRGAIWALGLLVSASAMLSVNASAQQIADTAALLARLPDSAAPKVFSKGLKATHRYRVPGAREEAQQGSRT